MYGISIDDRPDGPVATPETRRIVAIHWNWTTEYTPEEMAQALGVTARTVEKYLESPPAEEVREQLADTEAIVRHVAIQELKEQLRQAGHEAKTAETPVKIYQDDDGDLVVKDKENDDGEVVDRFPVPVDLEMGADQKTRYFRREEVREILDLLTDIVGAKAAERHKHEHSGDGGGPIEINVTETVVESEWEPPED